MLVLKRLEGSKLLTGEGSNRVEVTVVECHRGYVVLGVKALPHVVIIRGEMAERETKVDLGGAAATTNGEQDAGTE